MNNSFSQWKEVKMGYYIVFHKYDKEGKMEVVLTQEEAKQIIDSSIRNYKKGIKGFLSYYVEEMPRHEFLKIPKENSMRTRL